MRKVEKQMIAAIKARKDMKGRNTTVVVDHEGDRAWVRLHGHHIATYCYRTGVLEVNEVTLARWPSVTTKSRLRALGADVYTKNFVTYLDGVAV